MPPPRVRPPGDGDERAQLVGWLDLQRAIVHHKCEGLTDDDAYRVLLPTSPRMTVAGVVSHLRWTEHCWFEVLLQDRGEELNPQFGDVEDADFAVDGVPLEELLEQYDRQCAASNEVVAATPLDAFAHNPRYRAGTLTLRWMLAHMIEETARHAGHLDLLREQLDGRRGYY